MAGEKKGGQLCALESIKVALEVLKYAHGDKTENKARDLLDAALNRALADYPAKGA